MECPSESAVAAFVGDGGFTLRNVVEDHVDDCAACRALLAGLVRSDTRAWRTGLRVGRYVVGEPIGRGGMGAVWKAEDVELGRAVALKRLHAGGRDRLVREARTAAQLQHPNVVAVYEVVDPADSAPFLAMELVDGQTLTAWLRETPRTWREIVAVVAQAGRGLIAAHARGLVHRDFKPDNILVDRDGRARVADFGLASAETVLFDAGATASCKLARVTASAAGTPAYMAPELVDGDAPDVRTDVYAFAVTLFEALHGQHPFTGTTVETIWLEMAAGRVRTGTRRIPRWLERCVRRGLAVDAADRWPDMHSFVAAIDRHRSTRRYAIAAAVAGFGVAAGAAALIMPSATDECAIDAARADRVWNPRARAVLTAQLVGSAPDAAAAATTVKLVDGWTRGWQIGRRDACSAGDRKPARLACLDRQLDELGAQLAAWSSGVTGKAVTAAAALPSPAACDTAAASGDPIAQTLDTRVIEVRTLWNNGRGAQARPLLAALLRDVEATGSHATRARALLIASMIEEEQAAMAEAADHATRAAAEASLAGDDAVLYAALIQNAWARIDGGQPADALGICDAADALALRGVPSPEKVPIARGGALMRLGRIPEAIAQYEKAIAMLSPAAKTEPLARISLSIALSGLGNAYLESRDSEHAIERQKQALALQEAVFGVHHPEVARTLHDLAQAEESARDYDSAVRDFKRARAIQVAAFGVHHSEVGEIDVALATIAARTGAIDDARAMFDRARAELATSLPPTHMIFSVIEGQLGSLEQNADRAPAAIPHYERAYAILVANHVGGDDLARVDINWAACLLDAHQLPEAKAKAEETLEQLTRAGMGNHEKATARMVLALIADERGDRTSAIAYAKQVVAATSDDDRGQIGEARKIMMDKLRAWHAGV